MAGPPGRNGFTLIEVMIALGLFALISVAGIGLVEAVIGVQERTRTRLDRIAEIRRAEFVIGLDLDQIEATGFSGTATGLTFRRHGLGPTGSSQVRYALSGTDLARQVGEARPQPLLKGIAALGFRYYADRRWSSTPPRAGQLPQAIAVEARLPAGTDGPAGSFRRIAVIPGPL